AEFSSDVICAKDNLYVAMKAYDCVESSLVDLQELRDFNPEILKILSQARSIRMAADPVMDLLRKLKHMQEQSNRVIFHPPTFELWRSLNRTNAQVRHDRGSVTPSE